MMKKLLTLVLLLAALATTYAQTSEKPKATLNHLAIYVKDLKATANFYENILGLDTLAEPFHDGRHIWLNIGPGISMHVIQGAEKKKEYYKNQHICFSVASVEGFTQILTQNKLSWEDRDGAKKLITTRIDGVKQIWLQDPDGYWIEINDAK